MTIDRNCLDAETVAAWMDGGLDAAGVAAAEAHASTCERCQALLATVTKTLPVPEPGRLEAAFIGSKTGAGLWRWWLAPIAATAAAVTIWMVVPQTPMQTPMQPPAESAPARDAAAADAPAKPQAESALADRAAPTPAPSAATPRDSLADSRRNVPAQANEAQAKATVAAGANTAKFDEALGRKDQESKREENKKLAAVAERAREASAAARDQAGERRQEMPAAPSVSSITQLRKQGPLEIVSPDPKSRWRTTAPGTVERSEDGGRIWVAVRILAKEEVLAGAAPNRLVCWLVGRNGLVLLATDGTNFTPLPFPEPVDLVAISSPEPRIATVTTADGRTFRTEDAGRTWRQ